MASIELFDVNWCELEDPLLIANPIYDVVFKYLMDDEKVARLLISALLGEVVEELRFRPTEVRTELAKPSVLVLRMDFAATISLADGNTKLVLIEIQKAQTSGDIMRFRKYLGSQYSSPDNTYRDQNGAIQALPIITIYFLGEALDPMEAPVLHIQRSYLDKATGGDLGNKHPFVEGLTHDCIIVQVPKLKAKRRNELEILLSVFDQSRATGDIHLMELPEDDLPEKYQAVTRRLVRALAEREVRDSMDLEDEMMGWMLEQERAVEAIIEAKDRLLEAKDKALEEKNKALEEQARLIKELQGKLGSNPSQL